MRTRSWNLAAAAALIAAATGCTMTDDRAPKRYEVNRLDGPISVDGNWDAPAWRNVKPLELTYFMGDEPEHRPRTQAKLLYDDASLHVIFRVEDQYVRAVAPKHQAAVCRDSCVEFFFAPGTDVSKGYFNLEMNCGGTMLYHFQVVPRKNQVPIDPEQLERIEVAHALPRIIDPELAEPTTWTVQYRLPTEMLGRYYPGACMPAPGVTWRANFYKCADSTSHPHWLTWSYVDRPRPDFHVPECFGTLVFK